jgi:transposase
VREASLHRLAQKIVQSVTKGVSKSETARRFRVDRLTVRHYLKQLDEEGALSPKKATSSSPKLQFRR